MASAKAVPSQREQSTRSWPALDIAGVDRSDFVLALLDDFAPTAVEEHESSVRAFFSSSQARDAARAALAECYAVQGVDLPDDDWARRSQDNLSPITVGRITILPRPEHPAPAPSTQHPAPSTQSLLTIVIQPSMGFGTGHHATTRLCLMALQTLDVANQRVLDVGTGSGVLALASSYLGARQSLGLDSDPDAIQAARENLVLNPRARNVAFEVADVVSASLPEADIVTANLTGALLARAAQMLVAATSRNGALILSGLLAHERADVLAQFIGLEPAWEESQDEWLGLVLRARHRS